MQEPWWFHVVFWIAIVLASAVTVVPLVLFVLLRMIARGVRSARARRESRANARLATWADPTEAEKSRDWGNRRVAVCPHCNTRALLFVSRAGKLCVCAMCKGYLIVPTNVAATSRDVVPSDSAGADDLVAHPCPNCRAPLVYAKREEGGRVRCRTCGINARFEPAAPNEADEHKLSLEAMKNRRWRITVLWIGGVFFGAVVIYLVVAYLALMAIGQI